MLTAAAAALSISTLGALVAFGPAEAVLASETPGPVQSDLLPKSVVEQAQTEDQAITEFQIPETVEADAPEAASLSELVAELSSAELPDREAECLAGAIYFEAKGESLTGQLAVGRVIVARTQSGRFPASYCGVVLQPSQFSFVRGRSIPSVNRSSPQWQRAAAIARIAHADAWESPVEGALFFHATHVAPRWRLTRMARVENHVFYR